MKTNPTEFKAFVSNEKFFEDGINFRKDKSQSYNISYPYFLDYFNNIGKIEKEHLIVGINFTYGWMPTILDFGSDRFDDSVKILNKAKSGEALSIAELEVLKQIFNNSMVGTSKLLHFIRPDKFAIWDSRVFRYLTGLEPYAYRIGKCDTFLTYQKFCLNLTSINEFDKVHNVVCKEIGYSMTRLRTIELVMYQNGIKTNNNDKI